MAIQLRTDTSESEHNLRNGPCTEPDAFADCMRFLRITAMQYQHPEVELVRQALNHNNRSEKHATVQ